MQICCTLFLYTNAHHRPNLIPSIYQKNAKAKCGCINPFPGNTGSEPRNTCSKSHWCFVNCSSDCYDVKPTDGGKRCFSAYACRATNLLPTISTPSVSRTRNPSAPKVKCACINPLSGANAVMGDPERTCAALDYCFVEANADCSDVQPAPGEGRWYSHDACDLKPVATTIPSIPIIPVKPVASVAPTIQSIPVKPVASVSDIVDIRKALIGQSDLIDLRTA